MPSTYDSLLRLELQATGENENTWGEKANTNFELLGAAIAGHVSVAVGGSGNYTLSTANASTDEARRAFITLSGTLTGNRVIIVPSSSKVYAFRRNTSGNFTITVKTSGGTAATLPTSGVAIVVCDGTDCWLVEDDTKLPVTGGTLSGAITVSVSTSTSAAAGLKVTQTGTGPVVWFEDAGSDSTPFVINNTGQVLIGTSVDYNIVGLNPPAVQITRLDSTAGMNAISWVDSIQGPSLQLMKSRGADVGTYAVVSSGDILGSIWFAGDTGSEFQPSAAIRVYADASVSSSIVPGAMYFQVQSSADSGVIANAMVIKNNGNVGIGTTTPQEDLHVAGNVRIGTAVVSTPVGDAPFQGCRAYISYQPSGAVTKRAFNVASVTQNGTGDFTITFETSLTGNSYIMMPWGNGSTRCIGATIPTGLTAGAARVQFRYTDDNALQDPTEFHIAFIQ